MKIAWTIDDLAVWPHYPLPDGYTPSSVATKLLEAFDRNGVPEVFALANSWSLETYPEASGVLDAWVAAGHHIGNHTHAHKLLNDTGSGEFIVDIDRGSEGLAPWMKSAPRRAFRHPLGFWGDTEEKRAAIKSHLAATDYEVADATSHLFEWDWDRAWQVLRNEGKADEADSLKDRFIEFAVAQMAYDGEICRQAFGRDVVGIGLAHNLAFFAEVADSLFARFRSEGIEFTTLDKALDDPCYDRVGSFVTPAFQTYPHKVAEANGMSVSMYAPNYTDTMQEVRAIAARGAAFQRRSLVPDDA